MCHLAIADKLCISILDLEALEVLSSRYHSCQHNYFFPSASILDAASSEKVYTRLKTRSDLGDWILEGIVDGGQLASVLQTDLSNRV